MNSTIVNISIKFQKTKIRATLLITNFVLMFIVPLFFSSITTTNKNHIVGFTIYVSKELKHMMLIYVLISALLYTLAFVFLFLCDKFYEDYQIEKREFDMLPEDIKQQVIRQKKLESL